MKGLELNELQIREAAKVILKIADHWPLKKFVVKEVDRNMKDDSLGDVTLIKKPDVIKAALGSHNVYETEIWNKAIEAAANSLIKAPVFTKHDFCSLTDAQSIAILSVCERQVRSLKK